MGKHIGIDLGTTNTVAAIMEGPKARILEHVGRTKSTPSIVYASLDGAKVVGSEAKALAGADPEHTVISIKRLIGRQYDDENVQKAKEKFQYRIEKNPHGSDVVVPLRGTNYSPTEISAEILKRIKSDAEKILNEEVTHAVITVPAHFDPIQREQTRRAGEMAGLRVKKVIGEPTAAAIAYNMDRDQDQLETVVIFDLGGGTFDISCLLSQNGMHMELAVEGDRWLGGDDFDQALIDYCLGPIRSDHPEVELDRIFMFSLRKAVETAKKELSASLDTVIHVQGTAQGGGVVDIQIPITRTRFESLIRIPVERTVDLTATALEKAMLLMEHVDCILLVGGSTAVPLVREILSGKFGDEKVSSNIDPMSCVAIGAAKLARDLLGITCPNLKCAEPSGHLNPLDAVKCELCGFELIPEITCPNCGKKNEIGASQCKFCSESSPGVVVREVTPVSYGIGIEGQKYEIIFPQGNEFPSSKPFTKQFMTVSTARRSIQIPIYEGEDTGNVDKNRFLGMGEILVANGVPAKTPVDVSINMDGNRILQCEAKIHFGDAESVRFEINPSAPNPPNGLDRIWQKDEPEEVEFRDIVWFYFAVGDATLKRFAKVMGNSQVKALSGILNELEDAEKSGQLAAADAALEKCREWFKANSDPDYKLLGRATLLTRHPDVLVTDLEEIDDMLSLIETMIRDERKEEARVKIDELRVLVNRVIDELPPVPPDQQVRKTTKLTRLVWDY